MSLNSIAASVALKPKPEFCCPECASESGRVWPEDYREEAKMSISILSVREWQNLLAALKNPIERYGIDAVLEAVKYLSDRR